MTIEVNEFPSEPCTTIHYTPHMTLEQSICCEMVVRIHTHTILVLKMATQRVRFPLPHLKSKSEVTIVDNEFQSDPYTTIHFTHNETLKQSCWCEMVARMQTHSPGFWLAGGDNYYSRNPPTFHTKIVCFGLIKEYHSISTLSTSYYKYNEWLEKVEIVVWALKWSWQRVFQSPVG